MPTARERARAAAAALARSGVDITSASAVRAARGTAAHAAARKASREGGLSREELAKELQKTQPKALEVMAKKYGGEYATVREGGFTPEITKAARAGLPIAAVAKAAYPIVKTVAGFAAGAIGGELLDRGTDMPAGNRYGGWTDIGIEGPGIFRPKDVTPTFYGTVVKQWVANGTLFQRNEDGTISVQRKDGTVKTYRPYKPIVFGKKTDARKLARVAKKHRSIYKELHKLFGTKTRTVKA